VLPSLEATLAAASRTAVLEEEILNTEHFLIYRAEAGRPTVSKRRGQHIEPRQTSIKKNNNVKFPF
jgi:hypothetical protein